MSPSISEIGRISSYENTFFFFFTPDINDNNGILRYFVKTDDFKFVIRVGQLQNSAALPVMTPLHYIEYIRTYVLNFLLVL